jgi:hypothetical protein
MMAASMRRFLLLFALLLPPSPAAAVDICLTTGPGTWSGDPCSGYSGTWSCGDACSADDVFYVDHALTVDGNLGSASTPLTGLIVVRSGGNLDFTGGTDIFHHGELRFETGSDADLRGSVFPSLALPAEITFPTPTTIRIDWSELVDPDGNGVDDATLPWPICDSAVSHCERESTVHQEDFDPGEEKPPTLLYFETEKAGGGASPPPIPRDGRMNVAPVYDPMQWLPVVEVADSSGGGVFDTVVLALPTTGPIRGSRYFGADGTAVPTPDGDGRCEECMDAAGAPAGNVDTSGFSLRNAVDEPQWTLNDPPFQVGTNTKGQRRWEILLEETATDVNGNPVFDSSREFEGFLACKSPDPADPRQEIWCARIIETEADSPAHPDPGGEVFTVWNDPTGALAAGDVLNVYYSRPTEGDQVVPLNAIRRWGGDTGTFVIKQGSNVGKTVPVQSLWMLQMGGNPAVSVRNCNGFRGDLIFMEHQGSGNVPSGGNDSCFGINIDTNFNSDPVEPLDCTDLQISRYSYRAPDTDRDLFAGQFSCVPLSPRAKNTVASGSPDLWTNFAFRKLRGENVAEAFGYWTMDIRDCKDDLWIQDFLALHGRWIASNLTGHTGWLIEGTGKRSDTCGIDRLALVGATSHDSLFEGCHDCDVTDDVYLGSVVSFGANDSVADAIRGVIGRSEFRNWVVNYMSDGDLGAELQYAYGATVDFFGANANAPGFRNCQSNVGLFAIGSSNQAWLTADGCEPTQELVIADLYKVNLGNGSGFEYLRTRSNMSVTPQRLVLDGFLFHRNSSGFSKFLQLGNFLAPLAVSINDGTVLNESTIDVVFDFMNNTVVAAGLELGPNVFANSIECTGTQIFADGATCVVNDTYAPWGDGVGNTGVNTAQTQALPMDQLAPEYQGFRLPATSFSGSLRTACGTHPCDVTTALPRWSGPVAYDWPFAWATVNPVPGFRRASPRTQYLPSYMVARLTAECSDGIDNDLDGRVDYGVDPGCEAVDDPYEKALALPCDDGLDNDGDGRIDFDPVTYADPGDQYTPPAGTGDPGCNNPSQWTESPQSLRA